MKKEIWLPLIMLLLAAGFIGWQITDRLQETDGESKAKKKQARPVPVEVADIQVGDIELRRAFSGTLPAT